MDQLIIGCIFSAVILTGLLVVKAAYIFVPKAENIARSIGLKKTEDFYAEVESNFIARPAKLLDVKMVEHPSSDPINISYSVEITAIFSIGRKHRTCNRSLFSMVPTFSNSLAVAAVKLANSPKNVLVYYEPGNESNALIIIDGVKSWRSLESSSAR